MTQPNEKGRDLILTLLGIGVSIVPEIPLGFRLFLMFCCLLYPVYRLLTWGLVHTKFACSGQLRWVIASMILLVGIRVLGYFSWPRTASTAETPPPPEQKKEEARNSLAQQHSEGSNSPNIFALWSQVTINFNYPNSFDKTSPEQKTLRTESPLSQENIIERIRENVFLAERYGGEWQAKPGESIVFWRGGKPDILRKTYNPNPPENPILQPRFTPIVYHKVRGLVIQRATIYLKIPRSISVKTLNEPTTPQAQRWTFAEVGPNGEQHYYTAVGGATERMGAGVIEPLFFTFTSPGTYEVEYILSLTSTTPIAGLGDIVGNITFEIS